MSIDILPPDIRRDYEVHEWKHACAILRSDFDRQLVDVIEILRLFRVTRTQVLAGGKNKSQIVRGLERGFEQRGWRKKSFETKVVVDDGERLSPTHEVDCVKGPVALEIEWNNKDPFFDRDLNNFRLLFDLRAISVGIIITKSNELIEPIKSLGKKVWDKYGMSTTWMSKLLPRIEGGGGGGCPLLVFGIARRRYVDA